MNSAQKIAAAGVAIALAAAIYGIVELGRPSIVSAKKKAAGSQSALVDQTPLKTAQDLAKLADTQDEQKLAQDALRLGDHELDEAFAIALHDAEAHPPALSAEALEIEVRLNKAQRLHDAVQAQVTQLTAQVAKASGEKKDTLQDQLDLAQADLDLAENEVDDAKLDLADAGGNLRDRVAQAKQEHEAADRAQEAVKFPAPVEPKPGLVHLFEEWFALRNKKALLTQSKSDADRLVASLTEQHNALSAQTDREKTKSPDLAIHSKAVHATTDASAIATAAAQNLQKSRTSEESKAMLGKTKAVAADQRNLASFDRRVDNEKELSATYAEWADLVSQRQRAILRRILIGAGIVLSITLVGLFFNSWLDKILGTLHIDRRQIQTLRTTASVSVQVVAILFVLLVIFGPPGQLGTFIGLATAGLTVALKDFIVGFLGWFVLMRKNGIRLGDWVEINGVTGEVIEIGLFHTVLLETGNWTDSGHPTGRRVTFTNSYAIEGHYFNFSTSGQWLWDELQVVLPTGEDPYPVIDAIQKSVVEATQATAKEAAKELRSAAGSRDIGSFSAEPAINLRPVLGGIELSVRYITQANQRSQLRTKLNQAAVDLLGKRNVKTVSGQPPTPASAS